MKKFLVTSILTAIVILSGVFFLKENIGLVQIDSQQINNVLNDNSEIAIYIGRPTCPYCKLVQPELNELAEGNYTKLFYFNTDKERKTNQKAADSILKKLGVKTVPTVVVVKDGKVKHSFSGTDDFDKIQNYLSKHQFKIL